MMGYLISSMLKGGYLVRAGKLYHAFKAKRQARAEHRKQIAVLRDLSSVHLRDIGYIRDDILDPGSSGDASDPRNGRAALIEMTF